MLTIYVYAEHCPRAGEVVKEDIVFWGRGNTCKIAREAWARFRKWRAAGCPQHGPGSYDGLCARSVLEYLGCRCPDCDGSVVVDDKAAWCKLCGGNGYVLWPWLKPGGRK